VERGTRLYAKIESLGAATDPTFRKFGSLPSEARGTTADMVQAIPYPYLALFEIKHLKSLTIFYRCGSRLALLLKDSQMFKLVLNSRCGLRDQWLTIPLKLGLLLCLFGSSTQSLGARSCRQLIGLLAAEMAASRGLIENRHLPLISEFYRQLEKEAERLAEEYPNFSVQIQEPEPTSESYVGTSDVGIDFIVKNVDPSERDRGHYLNFWAYHNVLSGELDRREIPSRSSVPTSHEVLISWVETRNGKSAILLLRETMVLSERLGFPVGSFSGSMSGKLFEAYTKGRLPLKQLVERLDRSLGGHWQVNVTKSDLTISPL
jgi:hypothetical protein